MSRLSSTALLALALGALAACGEAEQPADTTTADLENSAAPADADNPDVVVVDGTVPADNDGTSVTVGPDGGSINTDGVNASVESDGDVSATVRTDGN